MRCAEGFEELSGKLDRDGLDSQQLFGICGKLNSVSTSLADITNILQQILTTVQTQQIVRFYVLDQSQTQDVSGVTNRGTITITSDRLEYLGCRALFDAHIEYAKRAAHIFIQYACCAYHRWRASEESD